MSRAAVRIQTSQPFEPRDTMALNIQTSTTHHSLPAFLTEQEVADYLRLPKSKLRRLAYEKRGPRTMKIAGQHRIAREDFLAWLASQGP